MLNSLVLLYTVLFHNFGLVIIVFTVLVRLLTFPLTVKQVRQTQGLSALQPKMQELQKKHGKDRQRLSQETMKLYKEQGISPLGCLGPMVVQIPIWIGLYQAVLQALPSTPEALVGLSQRLYPWLGVVHQSLPLKSSFLWLDLGRPDSTPVLPLLVGVSMWVQQKMTTLPTADPKQASQNQIMLWMLPLMFTFFTFTFPSGLALYWGVSNLVGIGIQYFISGWGGLLPRRKAAGAPVPALVQPGEESSDDGKPRSDSQDGRGGHRTGPETARRSERRRRNRGNK
ncbi:MAG: membrane protein insertase YidC [Chloroflexi bacterium]|nr:membrane protein insertase YidC [Chloroflexota bacterium]